MTGYLKTIETIAGQTIGIIRENGQVEDCTVVPESTLSGAPLTQTFWVDPGRVGSLEDGSIANPFLTAQAAIDALELAAVSGTIILAAGQAGYLAENLVIAGTVNAINLIGCSGRLGSALPFFNSISIADAGGSFFSMENCGAVQLSCARGQLEFTEATLLACSLDNTNVSRCTQSDLGGVNTVNAGTVDVHADNSNFGSIGTFGIPANLIDLKDCTVSGGLLATTVRLVDVKQGPPGGVDCTALELTDSELLGAITAGTTKTDGHSLQWLRLFAFSTTLGTITITDRPLTAGVVFAVPALAAAAADVTVALADAKPGDTFALASSVRLAGVGQLDSWSPSAGNLTVRFFGTTAGGNVTLDVTQFTNSGL